MLVIPRMLIRKGQCVTLERGRLDSPVIWHVDPLETAARFAAEGAAWIHVTDLDAVADTGSNEALLVEIIRRTDADVQVAGGIRTRARVDFWADKGAARIVLGTGAVRTPRLVREAAKDHPDQIAVAVDVWEGKVLIGGWQEPTAFAPVEFVKGFDGAPLAAFIVTDIDREVDERLSSFALTTRIARETGTPVISCGMVRTLDDVSTLKYIYNIHAAMIGKPLYDRSLALADCIRTAQAEPEPVAEFR